MSACSLSAKIWMSTIGPLLLRILAVAKDGVRDKEGCGIKDSQHAKKKCKQIQMNEDGHKYIQIDQNE